MSSRRVLEVTEDIFDHKPLKNDSSRGPDAVFSACTKDWVPYQRVFESLHNTYLPLLSSMSKTTKNDLKEAENKIHKELLGRNQLLLIKPSDTLGLMSPETYNEWSQDEVINLTTSEQVLKLPFDLAVPRETLDAERTSRKEVVRLHTSFLLLAAASEAKPEVGEVMSAVSHTLLPCLYNRVKEWLNCKFKCRWAALQLQKNYPTFCLLQSNPWNARLFDMDSSGTEETDWIKTHGWSKILSLNEKTAKVIKSSAKNIDWEKHMVAPQSKSSRFFRRSFVPRERGSSSYIQGNPPATSGHRFKPYSPYG